MIVLFGDEFIDESACRVPLDDRGMTLGDGIFDTLLAIDGKPVYAAEHWQRLQHGAAVMGIDFDLDFETSIKTLLARNGFTSGRYAVRTTITRGSGMRGLAIPEDSTPLIIMRAASAPENKQPATLVIAQNVRRNEHSPLSRIKSLNYGDNILAVKEAQEKGADDALMLNTAGNIACTTAGNIFIAEDGTYITPPLSDGILDGITRKIFISRHGAREESITPERLLKADTAFLTNSILGIRPITKINDTVFEKSIADLDLDLKAA